MKFPASPSLPIADLHSLSLRERGRRSRSRHARLRPVVFALAALLAIGATFWVRMTSMPWCSICEGVHSWHRLPAVVAVLTAAGICVVVAVVDKRAPERIEFV